MVDCGAYLDFKIGPPHRYPLRLLLTKFAASCYTRPKELLQLVVKKGGHFRHKNSAGVTISDAITRLELRNAPESPHLDISREDSGSRALQVAQDAFMIWCTAKQVQIQVAFTLVLIHQSWTVLKVVITTRTEDILDECAASNATFRLW